MSSARPRRLRPRREECRERPFACRPQRVRRTDRERCQWTRKSSSAPTRRRVCSPRVLPHLPLRLRRWRSADARLRAAWQVCPKPRIPSNIRRVALRPRRLRRCPLRCRRNTARHALAAICVQVRRAGISPPRRRQSPARCKASCRLSKAAFCQSIQQTIPYLDYSAHMRANERKICRKGSFLRKTKTPLGERRKYVLSTRVPKFKICF